MSARMLLTNVVSFGLQVMVLVTAGAALARIFRIDEPRAMLAYWRTLLLACLLLPLFQPWNVVIPPSLAPTTTITVIGASAAEPNDAAAPTPPRSIAWPLGDLVLIALAVGIVARALWLSIGAYGLRRLRRSAWPLEPLPESVRLAQERIGAQAGMYVSERVSSPITFGVIRPVVVFPPSVSAMPADVQEAIACHELLHVQRRDWLYEIIEEAVRSVFWFHPAIWWLIGRIRLTREQVVDQAVIKLTDSRERYVEALLSVALASSPKAFSPVSPFLRRHLLKKRVARILQETTMTTRRLIASLTASAAALALATTLAVRSFPLEAQGQAPINTGAPVQVVSGVEHLLHGAVPEYPQRAIEQKIEGDVVVEMTLDDRGEVADARVLSGPEELRKATLAAVLQWHYAPSELSSTMTQATLRYRVPAEPLLIAWAHKQPPNEWHEIKDHEKIPLSLELIAKPKIEDVEVIVGKLKPDHELTSYAKILADHAEVEMEREPHKNLRTILFTDEKEDLSEKLAGSPRLADVTLDGVTEATAKKVLAQSRVAVGDSITLETAERISQAAQAIDEHVHIDFERADGKKGVILVISAR